LAAQAPAAMVSTVPPDRGGSTVRPIRFTACLAALALIAAAAPAADGFLQEPGERLPALEATTLDGAPALPAEQPEALLVHVFDPAGEVSLSSLAPLEEFVWRPLRDEGLAVVGIARGASADQARALARERGLTFPVVADPDRRIAALLSEGGKGAPRTILVDGDGAVAWQRLGYRPGREAEFRAVAEALLRGREIPAVVRMTGPQARGEGGGPDALAAPMVGRPAPKLDVESWINPPPEATEGRFILYEFWATWCGPCRQTMPHLEELWKERGASLVILSLSDEDPAIVRRFVEREGYTYPIGTDTQGRMRDAVGVRGIPHCILVNPAGVVVWEGHPLALVREEGLLDRLLDADGTPSE